MGRKIDNIEVSSIYIMNKDLGVLNSEKTQSATGSNRVLITLFIF